MKKTAEILCSEYNEKVDNGPVCQSGRTLQNALSDLEDVVTEEFFWKILYSVTDAIEEQRRLAFMSGYRSGYRSGANSTRTKYAVAV
jgi:hypothetical protein